MTPRQKKLLSVLQEDQEQTYKDLMHKTGLGYYSVASGMIALCDQGRVTKRTVGTVAYFSKSVIEPPRHETITQRAIRTMPVLHNIWSGAVQ